MSYVICSNDYDEENDLYSEINAPFSFQNILSNGGGLTIPKNAEIAVQSVKINKSSTFTVSPDFRFSVYFGSDIDPFDPTMLKNKVTSYPIDIRPFSQRQSVTSQEFADAISKELNLKLTHPLIYGNQYTQVHRNASGHFAGYNLSYSQIDDVPSEGVDEYNIDDILPFEQTGPLGFDYLEGELVAEAGFGTTQEEKHSRQCILSNFPLVGKHIHTPTPGLNNQPFAVNGLSACQEWAVGLIRGSGTNLKKFPSYYNLRNQFHLHSNSTKGVYMTTNFYCDYVIGAFQSSPNGNRFLRIFEASVNPSFTTQEEALQDDAPFVLNEIAYYGSHSNVFENHQYNWSTNNDGYDSLEIYLNGEVITATLDEDVDLINPFTQGSSTRENIFKPINQCCWCLYPKIYIQRNDDVIKIQTSPNYEYDLDEYPALTYTNDNQWWADTVKKGLEIQVGKECDTRFFNIIKSPLDPYQYNVLSNAGANHTNLFENYRFQMIVRPTPDYFAPQANAGILLGFPNATVVPYTTDNSDQAGDGGIMTSIRLPSISPKSLFVRLANFTHQSFNAGNGNRSKIIFHLPRFDNTGRDDGDGLYFEAQERFYLKLNNSEEFIQNSFEIDIVDDKEVVARNELVGKTIVCLHIQTAHH